MLEHSFSEEEEFYLKTVPVNISQRLITKLYLQHHQVNDKPDSKEKCRDVDLFRYSSFAKEGFILSYRADKEGVFPINHSKLLQYTWPYQGKMWNEIDQILAVDKEITIPEKPILPVFQQFLSTLYYLEELSKQNKGNLDNLVIMPFARDFDQILKKPTFWTYNITPEFVWDTIKEFEKTLNEVLFSSQIIPLNKLLKATHFFAATVDLYSRKE